MEVLHSPWKRKKKGLETSSEKGDEREVPPEMTESLTGLLAMHPTTSQSLMNCPEKDGVFVTRSIRRLPSGFDVKQFSDFTTCPWDCNYAALRHTMMHAKRVLTPIAPPVLAMLSERFLLPRSRSLHRR